MSTLNITKEWLEGVLSETIESFKVSSGSNPGDNYLGVLYTIEVKFPEPEPNSEDNENKPPLHLVVKVFPNQPSRQEMLLATNYFHKELKVYNTIIPELIRFQEDHKNLKSDDKIIPPVPKFFYGKSIDFRQNFDDSEKQDPLENCIVMNDLRQHGGFRLADRLVGFDLEHSRLVIKAQAKIHALSWVYKMVTGTESINEKFPFLKTTFFDDLTSVAKGMLESHFGMAQRAIENYLGDEEAELRAQLLKSVELVKNKCFDVFALFFCDNTPPSDPSLTKNNIVRVPLENAKEDEAEWLCLVHGDAWLNNEMFSYDDQGKPNDIMLVDLQWVREGNPMTDLTYNIYTSTTSEFRKAHLDELLELYYGTFSEICQNFGVAPFPEFSLSELKRRFHQAKIFGFAMTVLAFPMILSDPADAKDMETLESTDMNDVFKELVSGNPVENQLRYQIRTTDIVKELYEQGII